MHFKEERVVAPGGGLNAAAQTRGSSADYYEVPGAVVGVEGANRVFALHNREKNC